LIKRGAAVNVNDDGTTALAYASRRLEDAKEPEERRQFQRVVDLLKGAGAGMSFLGL
jgi:hypothetical protein